VTHPGDVSLQDRFVGCLLGCAVGDALGAPFEGLWSHSIRPEDEILAGFAKFEGYPPGQFTDTQLTVACVHRRSDLRRGQPDPRPAGPQGRGRRPGLARGDRRGPAPPAEAGGSAAVVEVLVRAAGN
jgi:hypothetical protein